MAIFPLPLLSSILLVGCGGADDAPSPSTAAPEPSSLVILTLDTTRADRIGAYGHAAAHTPNLDRMASRGLRFARAYAVVPLTTPSHSSMFTGLYPTRHGVRTNGDAVLPEELTTLAERLSAAGYRTAASVSAFVTTRVWNLDQGFDRYDDTVHASSGEGGRWGQERPADEVVDDALAWLAEGATDPRPFFLWVHLYDAHEPHRPPAAWAERMPGRPYDAEIAFVDEQVGRLRAAVDAQARPGGTTWIAIADHGEALSSEHGEQSHGTFLFDPTMHVPFIIEPATPLSAPLTVSEPTVSGVDLTPTALGLLGLPVPDGLDGVDLSGALRGLPLARPGVYMESWTVSQRFGYHPEVALAEGPLKLMDTPSPRLFDLSEDPTESRSLTLERPAEVARLRAQAREILSHTKDWGGGAPVAPEVVQQLEALGYLGAGGALDASLSSPIDAKDRLSTIQGLDAARQLGRDPATSKVAEQRYREILEDEPQLSEARLGLARLLERRGAMEETTAVLQEALALEPDSTVLRLNLGQALARQHREEEALAAFEAVLAQVPGDSSAQVGVLRMLGASGRDQTAIERAQAWLAATPGDCSLHSELAFLLMRRGDQRIAADHAQASLADGVPRPFVHEILARVATASGAMDAVERHLTAELEILPANTTARQALGNLYKVARRWDEAAAEYEFLTAQAEARKEGPSRSLPSAESEPDGAGQARAIDARRDWAHAVLNTGDYERALEILAPALGAAPEDPQVLLTQANILARLGRRAEGQVLFERAEALRALQQSPRRPAR